MFERFTDRARQVVVLAQEEARTLQHNYIGTEHILLGLLREEDGLAARVLESFGLTIDGARNRVVTIVGSGEKAVTGQIPFTPRAKKVLELSLREAQSLGENYIDTEQILLGILRENEGVASRILLDFDAKPDKVRNAVLGGRVSPSAQVRLHGPSMGERQPGVLDAAWLGSLRGILKPLGREIRDELRREPDEGDLLLALAAASEGLPGRALRDLGLDLDALWASIERLRSENLAARNELTQRIVETRAAKERAIAAREFETAAQLRDQERKLVQQGRAQDVVRAEVVSEIRRRLGLPDPSN